MDIIARPLPTATALAITSMMKYRKIDIHYDIAAPNFQFLVGVITGHYDYYIV